jgi:hypothetical protein
MNPVFALVKQTFARFAAAERAWLQADELGYCHLHAHLHAPPTVAASVAHANSPQ